MQQRLVLIYQSFFYILKKIIKYGYKYSGVYFPKPFELRVSYLDSTKIGYFLIQSNFFISKKYPSFGR